MDKRKSDFILKNNAGHITNRPSGDGEIKGAIMSEPGKQPHRMKAAVILAAGAVLLFLWLGFWDNGAGYWSVFISVLPPFLFFPVEEFLAMNNHNSPWCLAGGGLIIGGFLVWAIRAHGRKLRIWESALLGLIAVLLLLFLLPCLCAPREKVRRISCISAMKRTWLELRDQYPDRLPDHFEIQGRHRHTVRYRGGGRRWKEPRFILFEDGSRSHAGDLRHRLWSDGEIDTCYPWKGSGKCLPDRIDSVRVQ